jgi:branched-chain amino acid transport system permease protein
LSTAWGMLVQAAANGLAMGGLYILIALGITLLLSIMRILQLAHGEIYMLGAYLVYSLTAAFGINVFPAIAISMIFMAAVGLVLERFLFRPCRGELAPAVGVSIGLTLILQSLAVSTFGLAEKAIPKLAHGSIVFLSVAVPKDRVIATFIAGLLAVMLYLFLNRTRYGQAMVASAQNPEGALLRGISPHLMASLAMMIACGLAAAGGAMAGSIWMLTPTMGVLPLVKGLTIIVIGGMGSLTGAIIGGVILGLIDGIIPVFFGAVVTSIAPLLIVVAIIMLKPQGLFGHE